MTHPIQPPAPSPEHENRIGAIVSEQCLDLFLPCDLRDVQIRCAASAIKYGELLADDFAKERAELERKHAKEKAEHCEHCGSDKIYCGPPDCPMCGAPVCCQTCCKITTLENECAVLKGKLQDAVRAIRTQTPRSYTPLK